MEIIINSENQRDKFDIIKKKILRTELGMRAIAVMYNEHYYDLVSSRNIYRLKDNVFYRLETSLAQYELFTNEISRFNYVMSERTKQESEFCFDQFKLMPYTSKMNLMTSSIFDSIIFHSVSIFDYLSHYISYIISPNKCNTLYWTKLAKSAYGKDNYISKRPIKEVIKQVDDYLVKKLYDYRSDLIHNSHKQCSFHTSFNAKSSNIKIEIEVPINNSSKVYHHSN